MKWLRMLGLFFEATFEYRLRSFLWVLIPICNNLTLILFWTGGRETLTFISTYYILMTIGGLLTTSYVEDDVANRHIKQGELVNFLTKPISYYWITMLGEIPFRVLHAIYAGIFIGVFIFLFHGTLSVVVRPVFIPLVILIFVLGYLISFTFKMSISYLSFWFKDMRGFYEMTMILSIIFSGAVMPLEWYPKYLISIAHFLPFMYSGYYPIMALMKPYVLTDFIQIIAAQAVFLSILLVAQRLLWRSGVKEFTAVGQ